MRSARESFVVSDGLSQCHLSPCACRWPALSASLRTLECSPVVPSMVHASSRKQWEAYAVGMVRGGDLAVPAAAVSWDVVVDEEREVEVEVEVEYYEKLAVELDGASPLEIVNRALELFGNEIAIAFSGAEDVALIEYVRLTCWLCVQP